VCLCNSCSGLRLWILVLDELTEGNGNSVHIPRVLQYSTSLDPTGEFRSLRSSPKWAAEGESRIFGPYATAMNALQRESLGADGINGE
jgi:hypothetical protein